ncbi:MAG: hypothetical protein ACREMJ_10095, partial [Gemmatimonadales bacterium]
MTPRLRAPIAPALAIRALVGLAALLAYGASFAAHTAGRVPLGASFGGAVAAVVLVGALTRRYGIALPGNGFSSYVLALMLYALAARGWAFATLVAPFAIGLGDVFLRRLPVRAALVNAAHLTAGTAVAGLAYARAGGASGAAALAGDNVLPLAGLMLLLPLVVNGTFYLDLALGRSLAWADKPMTLRWEAIVYGASALLAIAWLRFTHADVGLAPSLVVLAGLVTATAGSVYVIRFGVRADELRLIQGLSRAIAGEMSLAKAFPRIQELVRALVPWEQMGFARYDPRKREMELVADTALGGGGP